MMVPMYIADRLVSDYDTDPVIQDLVDRVEFIIVPIVNPDGYVHTWGPDRLWRKNRRDNGHGTFGVDPNRNWDFGWGGAGSSGITNSETYRGTAPFSEPAIANNKRRGIATFGRRWRNIIPSSNFSKPFPNPWRTQ